MQMGAAEGFRSLGRISSYRKYGRWEKSSLVDAFIKEISARSPWVVVGYTDDFAAAWKKDRKQVIKTIELRKHR
jgi:hypothetical protein